MGICVYSSVWAKALAASMCTYHRRASCVAQATPLNTTKPVVSERYDEVLFHEPSDDLRERLTREPQPSAVGWRNSPHAKW